jgi:glycosyltransferase
MGVKVSIITCTRNSDKYLWECLHSVENQTYKNIEHIIIDGYSNDRTTTIIKQYIKRHHDYDVSYHTYPARGIANALNIGIKHSTGQIIHFLHSDDYYYSSNSITKVINYFKQNSQYNWILGNHLLAICGRTLILPNTFLTKVIGKHFLKIFPWMSHQNTFMRRIVYDTYGLFDETYQNNLDYDQWLRIVNREPVLFVNDNFSVFRVHKKSTTFNPKNYQRWFREYIKAHRQNPS